MKINMLKKYIPIGIVVVFMVAIVSLNSCKKELPPNPFDIEDQNDSLNVNNLSPKSIEGLYQNVFKPNCTTSGCHDGTFAPDFRSLESTYNSLVWADIVSNTTPPKDFMVTPGDADNSILLDRMMTFVLNTSGQMPLEVLPGSDYTEKKEEYYKNIKDWINEGAKDIFGNSAISINLRPQLTGFFITTTGSSTPLSRNVKGVIKIPASTTSIDLYMGISDKESTASQLTINKLQTSISRDDFSAATDYTMNIIPAVSQVGYLGDFTDFQHKITIASIDTLWPVGQRVFTKTIVNDGTNPDSDLPGLNTLEHLKNYYSFERIP